MKKPMPPTLLVLSIAIMVSLHFLYPVTGILPWPWNLLGIMPIVGGVVGNLWADRLFKEHKTTVKPHLQPTLLVEAGPFRISRNPMYVGMVAIAFGVALLLGSLTPLAIPFVFAVTLSLVFIPTEEQAMRQTFGDAWGAYSNRVRRWL